MTLEHKVYKSKWSTENTPHIQFHNTEILKPRAEFVKELVARWGMVQAVDNGEDSSGRHQLGLMPPADVVNRAMEVSDLMYKALAKNDLMIKLPTLDEMQTIADEMEDPGKSEILLDRLNARAEAKARQIEETE